MEPCHPNLQSADDWGSHPDWLWPFWKFGMQPEDLFTKLHQQYNTYNAALQDFEAFHHDVSDVAAQAATTQQFHELMTKRRQERLNEMIKAMDYVGVQLAARPSLSRSTSAYTSTPLPQTWAKAIAFFRNKSLDSIIDYFSSFIPDNDPTNTIPTLDTTNQPSEQPATTAPDELPPTPASDRPSVGGFDSFKSPSLTTSKHHKPRDIATSSPPPSSPTTSIDSAQQSGEKQIVSHQDVQSQETAPPEDTQSPRQQRTKRKRVEPSDHETSPGHMSPVAMKRKRTRKQSTPPTQPVPPPSVATSATQSSPPTEAQTVLPAPSHVSLDHRDQKQQQQEQQSDQYPPRPRLGDSGVTRSNAKKRQQPHQDPGPITDGAIGDPDRGRKRRRGNNQSVSFENKGGGLL